MCFFLWLARPPWCVCLNEGHHPMSWTSLVPSRPLWPQCLVEQTVVLQHRETTPLSKHHQCRYMYMQRNCLFALSYIIVIWPVICHYVNGTDMDGHMSKLRFVLYFTGKSMPVLLQNFHQKWVLFLTGSHFQWFVLLYHNDKKLSSWVW